MKFEYKVVTFLLNTSVWRGNPMKHEEVEQSLNELGQLGWELVSVDSIIGTNLSTREVVAYLKRKPLGR